MVPYWRASLVAKLFWSYLLVALAGSVTLIVVAEALGPTFFTESMARFMATRGMGSMMAQMAGGTGPMDAALTGAFQSSLLRALLVAMAVAMGAAFVASIVVSRRIIEPVRRMLTMTQHIANGHYSERVAIPLDNAEDEIGSLATSFNMMAAGLEDTERRRRELVGDIAHELRTPIATLEGYLEGLLDGVVAPSAETWARLHDEAGRLRRLVDDLQELSQAEAGQIPLLVQTVSPASLIQAAVDRLGPAFAEKGLLLDASVSADLPPVRADRDRAVQVLTNLLTNALRYTPAPGRVIVEVTVADPSIVFRVTDTGVGLSPAHLSHLFERFYRVDKSRARAFGGSGIGLTIARALVEAMGGRIWVDSAGLGAGSTFGFTLPLARRHPPEAGS